MKGRAPPPGNEPNFPTGDPAERVIQGMLEAAQAVTAASDNIARLLAEVEAKATTTVANHAIAEMHRAARTILLRRFRLWVIGAGITAVVLVALGAIAERLLVRPDIGGMTCEDQAGGGRVCFMWVTPPQQGKTGR